MDKEAHDPGGVICQRRFMTTKLVFIRLNRPSALSWSQRTSSLRRRTTLFAIADQTLVK